MMERLECRWRRPSGEEAVAVEFTYATPELASEAMEKVLAVLGEAVHGPRDGNTYEWVAQQHQLDPGTARRFIRYMRARWADEEETQCEVGYAGEWAERFKLGIEAEASDSEGRAILRQLGE